MPRLGSTADNSLLPNKSISTKLLSILLAFAVLVGSIEFSLPKKAYALVAPTLVDYDQSNWTDNVAGKRIKLRDIPK
jgi:hypothetical protein